MLPPLRSLQPAESCPLPAAAVCAVNSRIHVQIRPRASYNLDQLPKDFLHDARAHRPHLAEDRGSQGPRLAYAEGVAAQSLPLGEV